MSVRRDHVRRVDVKRNQHLVQHVSQVRVADEQNGHVAQARPVPQFLEGIPPAFRVVVLLDLHGAKRVVLECQVDRVSGMNARQRHEALLAPARPTTNNKRKRTQTNDSGQN